MNDTSQASQGEALKHLLESRSGGRSRLRWILPAVAVVLVAGGSLLFFRAKEDADLPRFKTVTVEKGGLVVRVSATGNLQPTNKVDVGSELSGIVEQVFVDVNDRVEKGQVIARLDIAILKDEVAKSRANLAMSEAQVLQEQATLAEARATLGRYRQVERLSGGRVPAKTDLETAEANLKRAEANVASARASVAQARAALQSDETNLYKAGIRSPIDGVVLVRDVEPGQTVAASFQAPILFTLAEDLAKMELEVDVDEADVGQVREGQNATFTVDAWPGRQYRATITRVSYGSQEKDGVVSYLTELQVDNDDLSLRPGMTGTAEITTLTRDGVLLVPNAALRFSPPQAGPAEQKGSLVGALVPRPPRQAPKTQAPRGGTPRVWVLRDGQPWPVEVQTGATNGRVTEITGGTLEPGTEVITEALGSAS